MTVAVDEVGGALAKERGFPAWPVLLPPVAEIAFQVDLGHLPFQKSPAWNLYYKNLSYSACIKQLLMGRRLKSCRFAASYLFMQECQS